MERAAAEQWEANKAASPKVQSPKGAGAALGLLPASAAAKPPTPAVSNVAQAKSVNNLATPKSAKATPRQAATGTLGSFGRGATTPASAKGTPSAKSTPQVAKGTPSAKQTPKSAAPVATAPASASGGGGAVKGPSKWGNAISPAAAPVSLRSDVSVAPAANHLPSSVAQADAAFAEAAPKNSAVIAPSGGNGAKAVMSLPRSSSGAKMTGSGAVNASPGMARPNSGAKASQQPVRNGAGKPSPAASRASPALLRLFGAAPPEEPRKSVAAAAPAPSNAAAATPSAPTSTAGAGASAGAKSPSKWGSAISPAAAPVSLQPEGYRASPSRDTAPPSVAEAKTSSADRSGNGSGAPARKMTAKAASLAGGGGATPSQPSKATARASAKATAKATTSSSNRVNLFGDSELSPGAAPAAGQVTTTARAGAAGAVSAGPNASFSVDDTFAFGFGDDTMLDAVFSPTRNQSNSGEGSVPTDADGMAPGVSTADGEGAGTPENVNAEEEARRSAAREKLASGFAPPQDYPLLFAANNGASAVPRSTDAFAMLSSEAAAAAAENTPPPASSPAARAKASAWNRAARLALEPPELAGPQWYLQQEKLAADALTAARTESQQLRAALDNLAQTSRSFQQRVQHSAYGGGGGTQNERSRANSVAAPQPSPFASHAHWHAENGGVAPETDHAAATPSPMFASSTHHHPCGHSSRGSISSSFGCDNDGYYGGDNSISSRTSLYTPGSAASRYGHDNFADLDAYLNAAFAGRETPAASQNRRNPCATPVERLLPQSSSSPYNRNPAAAAATQGLNPQLRPYALRGGVGDRLREIHATF